MKVRVNNQKLQWVFNKDIGACLEVNGGNVILGGGALQKLVRTDQEINDYDLFFKNKAALELTKAHFESLGYDLIFECPKGELFTYRKKASIFDLIGPTKVQLISKFFYDGPEDLIDSFDFTATQWAYDGENVHTTVQTIKDTKNKMLRLHKLTFPAATMNRVGKYKHLKGYKVPQDFFVDFLFQMSENQYSERRNLCLYIQM